jgi:hypothetical protein
VTPEGLSASEVGKELSEHAKHAKERDESERHLRSLSIAEAVLLSVVTLVAAWSGASRTR